MIYFTGDIHGAVDGIADFINKIHPTMEDVIVLLGDVGANYYTGRRDNLLKAFLNDAERCSSVSTETMKGVRPPYRDMLKQSGMAGKHGFNPSIPI